MELSGNISLIGFCHRMQRVNDLCPRNLVLLPPHRHPNWTFKQGCLFASFLYPAAMKFSICMLLTSEIPPLRMENGFEEHKEHFTLCLSPTTGEIQSKESTTSAFLYFVSRQLSQYVVPLPWSVDIIGSPRKNNHVVDTKKCKNLEVRMSAITKG